MDERSSRADVAVIGGGLGGLATAAYAARAGQRVVLCEKASVPGGRAMTTHAGDFRFNLGPHALYAGSHGIEVLRELGVRLRGRAPSASGAFAVRGGVKHALPGGFLSLVTTGLFGLPAKLETARLLAGFARIDGQPLARVPVASWLAETVRHPDVRMLVEALFRLSTYSNDPQRMSAGAAIRQLQGALAKGVLYLDGGWETLVDGLRAAAMWAGARIVGGARAAGVEPGASGWRVHLAGGNAIDAGAVVLAVGPAAAAELLAGAAGEAVRAWATSSIPVRAACLDLALAQLPQPRATFALGMDRPLYLSVHSAVATLGPEGKAVIQVAKYLGPAGSDPQADERELEGLMDLVQPGWRAQVVERRFLPDMLVANALPSAAQGGTAGRPGPAVPGVDGVYVVGDWVGPAGQLADASLASARRAAALIAERQRPAIVAAA